MRTYDLTPLFRSTVGFDRLARLMDSASQVDSAPSYPPYNIEKFSDDDYRITMAVAGFSEKDLEITVQENSLLIAGRMEKSEEDEGVSFLHRGIATRAFERRFDLADDIKVVGATVENGRRRQAVSAGVTAVASDAAAGKHPKGWQARCH